MHDGQVGLDEVFAQIRQLQRGGVVASPVVKEEPAEEVIVPCDRLLYTQKSCAKRFRGGPFGGKLLEEVIEAWVRGVAAIDPLKDEWLIFDVVRREDKLYSVDNRRLHMLKEYQRRVPCKVWVRIRWKLWEPLFSRYLSHSDSTNGGITIGVRTGGR